MKPRRLDLMDRELADIKSGLLRLSREGLERERLLTAAARKVVEARHYQGDDGWDRLKNAIGELEELVGRGE